MNLLLAAVYNNYKRRLEQNLEDRAEKRIENFEKIFDFFDKNKKGHLTIGEAKGFFGLIFDLDIEHNYNHALTFDKIVFIIDVYRQKILHKS